MFKIISWSDETKFVWHDVCLSIVCFVGLNTFRLLQLVKHFLYSFNKPFFDRFVVVPFKSVVIGIFQYSSEHERPGQPFNAITRIVDLSSGNLCVNVVLKLLLQRRFDWERVIQKFTVEVFLWWFAVNHCHTLVVKLGSSCSSDHLK